MPFDVWLLSSPLTGERFPDEWNALNYGACQ